MTTALYVTKVKRPRKYASRHRHDSAAALSALTPSVDPWASAPLARHPEFLRWFA